MDSLQSNETMPSNDSSEFVSSSRDENLASVEIGTLAVILVLAVTSNLMMLIAIWRQRRNRPLSRMYFFMMHLSLADLLVAIFNILPQLAWDITYRFQGGDLLCRFVKYTQVMTQFTLEFAQSGQIFCGGILGTVFTLRHSAGHHFPRRGDQRRRNRLLGSVRRAVGGQGVRHLVRRVHFRSPPSGHRRLLRRHLPTDLDL